MVVDRVHVWVIWQPQVGCYKLESPAAVAGQCCERCELGHYPAGTHTSHQQYSAWLAASAVSVARLGNSDHPPLHLAKQKKGSAAELWHSHWNHQRLGECRATSPQALSGNAALTCVTGCIDTVILLVVRWSDREHLFVRKEDKVSGILRELLKQKLSTLYASSAVCVCQLLCTAPLKTFETQIVTNNLGHRLTDDRWISVSRDISRTVLCVCGSSSWLKTISLTVSTFSSMRYCEVCCYLFRSWTPCWLLINTAVTSAVTDFRCCKLIAKVNK